MSLDSEQLQQTLKQLHEQLEDADRLDADVTDKLRQTIEEMQALVDQQQRNDDEPSLTERLGEAARHFEESHPTIAGTIGRLIDQLARMGI